jgi:hypothetical protein
MVRQAKISLDLASGPVGRFRFRFPFVTYTHANTLSTTSWDQSNCATPGGSQVPFAWCACALCSSLQSRLLSHLSSNIALEASSMSNISPSWRVCRFPGCANE